MYRKISAAFFITIAVVSAACSTPSTSDTGVSPDDAAVNVVSTGTNYDATTYEVAQGDVLAYSNESNIFHDIVIDDADFKLDVRPGDTAAAVVDLPPGDYVFYCSVPGHRTAGMQATLVVTP
ncbi:MAG: cupredoxin domain-containing protein [Actinobacteria bacterium]|nr:cupredoxin domain-containing protein [Actinomycetota bacterium]MCB9388776.1 cupredoxin domain-containing protein [Acidimicrobiia bacterium]